VENIVKVIMTEIEVIVSDCASDSPIVSRGKEAKVELPEQGVYIVTSGSRTVKIKF